MSQDVVPSEAELFRVWCNRRNCRAMSRQSISSAHEGEFVLMGWAEPTGIGGTNKVSKHRVLSRWLGQGPTLRGEGHV